MRAGASRELGNMKTQRLLQKIQRGCPGRRSKEEMGQIPYAIAELDAHSATLAQHNKLGNATTEDLRRAVVYYRALFEDLLEVQEARR